MNNKIILNDYTMAEVYFTDKQATLICLIYSRFRKKDDQIFCITKLLCYLCKLMSPSRG